MKSQQQCVLVKSSTFPFNHPSTNIFPWVFLQFSHGKTWGFLGFSHGSPQDVAGTVAAGGPSVLAKPKPCLLTQKLLTPRWRPLGESLGAGDGEKNLGETLRKWYKHPPNEWFIKAISWKIPVKWMI